MSVSTAPSTRPVRTQSGTSPPTSTAGTTARDCTRAWATRHPAKPTPLPKSGMRAHKTMSEKRGADQIRSGSRSRCQSRSNRPAVETDRARCPRRLDRVGGGAKVVLGHVRDTRGLAGGVGGVPRSSPQWASCAHRVPTAGASVHHPHAAAGPGAGCLGGVPWTGVRGMVLLEEVQHMLRALGSPQREEAVIFIGEHSATADGDQAGIADLGEDHATSVPVVRGAGRGSFGLAQRCSARHRSPTRLA